jgi:hypothetical protein
MPMIPLVTKNRLGHLAELSRHFAYIVFDHRIGSNDKLFLSSEVSALAHKLTISSRVLYPLLQNFSVPSNSVSLKQWAMTAGQYIDEVYRNASSERQAKLRKWVSLPKRLKSVQIWESKEMTFWQNVILENLAWLWSTSSFQLKGISWEVEEDSIFLIVDGISEVENFGSVSEEGLIQEDWISDVRSNSLKEPLEAISITVLITQFLALQGRGELTVEGKRDSFLMKLKIPRADTNSLAPNTWALSSGVSKQFGNEIANITAQAMENYRRQLEERLLAEVERLSLETAGAVNLNLDENEMKAFGYPDEAIRMSLMLRKNLDDLRFGKQLLDDWFAGHNPFNPPRSS